MNQTLIIYHSKYGHTKKYAQWLGISKKSKQEQTDEDKEFLATYGRKIDLSDKKMLEPVIQYRIE
jgi:hypothetical protein